MKSVVDVAIAFLSMLEKQKKPPAPLRASGLHFSFLIIHCEASCFAQSGDELLLHAGREAAALVPLEALERVVERLVVTGAAVQIAVEELARPAVADVSLCMPSS